ncbi:uncharacterized protein LOC134677559 [Cydia fagiglandana]|uniref:uncharacterized protein LOC134677559 n=1 Tax=Cydia fagiglandana TaxID=1458189 RepID=UPI002FEE5ECC
MRCAILLFLIYFDISESKLWSKGVVHYTINPKDYDIHSQDEIVSTFSALEKEICVKFFSTPLNYSTSETQKVLYISNPNKQKSCPPMRYNYSGSVVDMPIGYKCINKNDIARITIEMLRASIDQTAPPINSFDLLKRFEEQDQTKPRPTFLTTEDRDFINAHYHGECVSLSQRASDFSARRDLDDRGVTLADQNSAWYAERAWPLAVVMYSVQDSLRDSQDYMLLKFAMTQIELATCVVFHEMGPDDKFSPSNQLLFKDEGEDEPELGFKQGDQVISLKAMTHGAPGHSAHALNNLMRALGIPMMSNRFDRDNYLNVQWSHVQKGKERLLEKTPKEAWVVGIPYDFSSATHAPANFLCDNCPPGASTVQPLQDTMWRRWISMGHNNKLSESDAILVNLVYSEQCKAREQSGFAY